MEVKKATSIRSMEYEDFKNNDYLEDMVRRLNMDGAGIVLGTVDELINWGRSNSLWSLTLGTAVVPSNLWRLAQPVMIWPALGLR